MYGAITVLAPPARLHAVPNSGPTEAMIIAVGLIFMAARHCARTATAPLIPDVALCGQSDKSADLRGNDWGAGWRVALCADGKALYINDCKIPKRRTRLDAN
jgi:hypothetical protein